MISTKKLATIATSAAIFASSAMPAFAAVNIGVGNGNVLQNNTAMVVNGVGQTAVTGNATTLSGLGFGNSATSGDASNRALVVTAANRNVNNGCGCPTTTNLNLGALNGNVAQNNTAVVGNTVIQGAQSGAATTATLFGAGNTATSGNASNGAAVVTVVNSNVN